MDVVLVSGERRKRSLSSLIFFFLRTCRLESLLEISINEVLVAKGFIVGCIRWEASVESEISRFFVPSCYTRPADVDHVLGDR